MLKNENIICVSTMRWDALWTRKQRFMEMLSKNNNNVLYVEPFSWVESVGKPIKVTYLLKKIFITPLGKLKNISENLCVLTPSILIPFQRKFYFVALLNCMILKWQIKIIAKRLRFQRPILWVYSPSDEALVGAFGEKIVIYDCVDDHSVYPGANKKLTEKIEKALLKKANLVFATSFKLYEDKKVLNKNTFYIPNGVDFELFRKAEVNKKIPEDMINIEKPIIGWAGALRSWLDFDLIEYVAKFDPKWSIVFVGPMVEEVNLEPLRNLKNVFFLGRKTKEELPSYMQNFNVCLIPNKINELTNAMNPIKLYEYLAVGRPVVSVDLEEVRQLADVVKIAKDKKEFVSFIQESLNDHSEELILKRIKKAESHSWKNLFNEAVNYIEKALSNE